MDRKTLSPAELQQLKKFIVSRSARFGEPVLLLEILDHFACKTEEILEEEPDTSFEDAVRKAHQSFGVKGFAPIAAACEQGIYQKYKQLFRKVQRDLLFSKHMFGFLLAGLLCFKILMLLNAPSSTMCLVLLVLFKAFNRKPIGTNSKTLPAKLPIYPIQ